MHCAKIAVLFVLSMRGDWYIWEIFVYNESASLQIKELEEMKPLWVSPGCKVVDSF